MPVPIIFEAALEGVEAIPLFWPLIKTALWLGLIYVLRLYFGGATNDSERVMHGKVVMLTV
jgi:hypothetical protein